ncbi:MAG: sigma-70 family RNA polymerase sigma factor [Bdellovibrionales bacterium]|nr:sigma-70 family RNA polymerase sigma factor [Bdellovibrionales bacterium]
MSKVKMSKSSTKKNEKNTKINRRSANHAVSKIKKEKVVSLKEAKKKKVLGKAKKDELVLEFREKARKIARSILRRWRARIELQEVDSIVDLSLCEAVNRFDPTRGVSFITFLYYHLKGNLIRHITAAATHNSVPTSMLEWEDGLDSDSKGYRSANAIEIANALVGEEAEQPDQIYMKKEIIQLSEEACSGLDPLEKEVIERIYLQGEQLLDIAKSLGYSRCHISRVKKNALANLEESMNHSLSFDGTEVASLEERQNAISAGIDRKLVSRRKPTLKENLKDQVFKAAA